MSRKSGKPPRNNPFLQKDRDQLMDELNSIQEMLGEAGEDVDDKSVPTLTAEDGADAAVGEPPKGDAENQIPLLAPDEGAPPRQQPGGANQANKRLHQALKQRQNPFLSGAARAADKQPPAARTQDAPAAKQDSAPPAKPPADADRLDDREMRALVDEVLAAWLPKIERELRARLMEYLRDAKR